MSRRRDQELLTRIGARIRQARNARGITQAALAEACSIQSETVSRVENGSVSADISTLVAIAAALRLDLDKITCVEKPAAVRDDEAADLVALLAPDQRAALLVFLRTLTRAVAPDATP